MAHFVYFLNHLSICATSGGAVLRSKLVDSGCQIQFLVALVGVSSFGRLVFDLSFGVFEFFSEIYVNPGYDPLERLLRRALPL